MIINDFSISIIINILILWYYISQATSAVT